MRTLPAPVVVLLATWTLSSVPTARAEVPPLPSTDAVDSGSADGVRPAPFGLGLATAVGGLVGGLLGGGSGALLYLASGIGQSGLQPLFLGPNVLGPLAGVLVGAGLVGGLSPWPSVVAGVLGLATTVLIAAFPIAPGGVLLPWFVALALAPAVATVGGYFATWMLVERPSASEVTFDPRQAPGSGTRLATHRP